LKTLNAASAIWRAEALKFDIDEFDNLKMNADAADIPFGSIHEVFEAFSYYAVGIVTCLEWHARSRLVDLMVFKPDSIQTSDIKNIADLALSQMVSEGVNVPHLLGAATKVNSFADYLGVFKRVFKEIQISENLDALVHADRNEGEESYPSFADGISEIYTFRHQLVHEISFSAVGHNNIREIWTLEQAKFNIQMVVDCMKAIELIITKRAPKGFPNRLSEDGYEEDDFGKVEEAVAELEMQITAALANDSEALEAWEISLAHSKETIKAEIEFVNGTAAFAPTRYYDVRHVMRTEVLKSRLAFLTLIKSELR
jgi:hypothetical protein